MYMYIRYIAKRKEKQSRKRKNINRHEKIKRKGQTERNALSQKERKQQRKTKRERRNRPVIRKDCFQVKSNLFTDFRFTTHMNIMILN
jgi:hypothetical protein